MTFSIIVPSFNQERYINETLANVTALKSEASKRGIQIEILVFDSESGPDVQVILHKYKDQIDVLEIKKDFGQYDAINKGILRCKGEYWTWLNTDDLIDFDGFFKLADILGQNKAIDYIYGAVNYISESGMRIKSVNAYSLNLKELYSSSPAIFQPGSFFKKSFTEKIGILLPYRCCFDYEYVMRCIKNDASLHFCDFPVSNFRYYNQSKTGSITPVFIKEQLEISAMYGRKYYHFLTGFSYLRLLKHFLFPRK
jgi:glycosyltransferase involved in cell wall biosynthesis